MIDGETLNVIRRWALREQLSIREIARRTGLFRNPIEKYLRAGVIEPRYAKRISASKRDPFAEKLSGWLKKETSNSRKQRSTLQQIHADLVMLGFDGSCNRVAAIAGTRAVDCCAMSPPSMPAGRLAADAAWRICTSCPQCSQIQGAAVTVHQHKTDNPTSSRDRAPCGASVAR